MVKHEFYNNPRFHHVQHPLVEHKLALLRDSKTTTKQFMELAEEIAMLIGYEALRTLELEDVEVEITNGTVKEQTNTKEALKQSGTKIKGTVKKAKSKADDLAYFMSKQSSEDAKLKLMTEQGMSIIN